MNSFGRIFLRGLAFVIPIGLTIYLIYAIAIASENVIGGAILEVLPRSWYWPGLGLVVAVGLVFVIGLLTRIPAFNLLIRFTDWLFDRMPVVRSVYSILKDFADFMSAAGDSPDNGRPVLVTIAPDTQVIGFITNDNPKNVSPIPDNSVIVYLPMSYQIGGYSIIVPEDRVTSLDMTMEDAMGFVVTAGIKSKSDATKS